MGSLNERLLRLERYRRLWPPSRGYSRRELTEEELAEVAAILYEAGALEDVLPPELYREIMEEVGDES